MSMDLSRVPGRRNVADLGRALGELQVGDPVVATFRSPRYGVYVVRGRASSSRAHDGLVVSGHVLGAPGKVSGELMGVARAEDDASGVLGGSGVPDGLKNGDLVTALLDHDHYGTFTVTGHLVGLGASLLMVGGWIVAGGRSALCARVVGVTVEARVEGLVVPDPVNVEAGR